MHIFALLVNITFAPKTTLSAPVNLKINTDCFLLVLGDFLLLSVFGFLVLFVFGREKLDGLLDLLMLFDGSSSGAESSLQELEGSLIDFLDAHFEQLEDSLLEGTELGDRGHEFSDLSDSVAGS